MFAILTFSLGAALSLEIYLQSARFTILDHGFRPGIRFFGWWALIFVGLLLVWIFFKRSRKGLDSSRLRGLLPFFPLFFLLLSPLLLHFYTTRGDLRVRLRLLGLFVLLAVFFLKAVEYVRRAKKKPAFPARVESLFSGLPLRRKILLLFLASFLVYQAAALILVWQGTSFSGDEPYYLLSSHSLLKDGDINLANNYAREDYFSFYSKKDHPRLKLGIYGRYGRKGKDYIYPINLPGISVLMLPFYWLSQFFSGKGLTFILKGSLSLWGSLLGIQIYLYARERWERERLSLGLWALYSFSAPILFYAVHLYPEIPIAFFSFYIFRKVTGKEPLSVFRLVLCGLLLGLFPWFGLKFNFLFYPLLLVSIYFLLKEHKAGFRVLAFAALPVVSMVLFYVFIHALYGTFSPIAVYEGIMTPERTEAFKQAILGIPFRARIDSFLDYFLDQRDGLLLYSPVYFFSLLGLIELYRRRRRDFWCLLLIGLPFLLNYALFTHRQGSAPQGRVLAPLSWVGAIGLGYFLVHNRRRIFHFLCGVGAASGFAVAGILLGHPSFLYQPTTHEFTSRPGDLFVYLSNMHFFLPPFLPSFIKVDNTRYWPNYVWVAAVLIFVFIYAFSRREKRLGPGILSFFASASLTAAFLLWVLFPRSALYPVKTVRYSPQRALAFYTFSIGKGAIAKDNGDFYLHLEKPYRFLFASRTKLEQLKLRFGSEKGEYEMRLGLFDLPILEEKTAHEIKEIVIQPEAAYVRGKLYFYEISLRLTHLSAESMLLNPFLFQVIPERE
ncbi:MAG: hypothetical protein AB1715_06360 [Acidobacteriota bacterium]